MRRSRTSWNSRLANPFMTPHQTRAGGVLGNEPGPGRGRLWSRAGDRDGDGRAIYRDVMSKTQVLEVAGREVTITNPDKIVFVSGGHPKLDLVRYYLAVADGALRGVKNQTKNHKQNEKGNEEEAF